MVKRKPPYILGSVVVLCIGAAFLINAGSHPPDEADQKKPPQQQAPSATGPAKGNEDPEKLKEAMKGAVGQVKPAPKPTKPQGAGGPPGVPGDDPLVVKKPAPYKPKPTDTQVSGQWWDSNSAENHR